MVVSVQTKLRCSAQKAWEQVQKSSTLLHVSKPLARIVAVDQPFPERWTDQSTYFCRSYLFGFIPVGKRTLHLERVDQAAYEIQSRESDPLIQRWDHLISIKPIHENECLYSDEIEIEAGLMTFAVWLWAQWFYRHRQARWRKLARS